MQNKLENDTVLLPSKEWFNSHYDFAANVIGSWLSEVADMPSITMLDFGCGDGITDLGICVKFKPKKLLGVDITEAFQHIDTIAKYMAGLKELPDGLEFHKVDPSVSLANRFKVDVICSWSSFEHIDLEHLDGIISDLFNLLPPKGFFLLQVEPLYYSPFGSHLERYVKEPWAHLLYNDEVILRKIDEAGGVSAEDKDLSSVVSSQEDHKNYIFLEYKKLNLITADNLVEKLTSHGFEVVKQVRQKTQLIPPSSLLQNYSEEDLLTNELVLLLQKPSFSIFKFLKRILTRSKTLFKK